MSENPENANLSAKKLQSRYKIGKSVLYKRLNALGIKPQRQGAYVSADQLTLMDDLDAHVKAGGSTDEFAQKCLAEGRIVPAQKTLVTQTQEQTTTGEVLTTPEPDAQEEIENLMAQKNGRVTAKDFQEVDERSQYRAAAKIISEETRSLFYEATGNFTIPGLNEQVEQHQLWCDRARSKRTMAHDLNNFLSQSLLRPEKATSGNG